MRAVTLVLLLPFAACGALPQPFFGNPGRDGARLTQPPPSRLALPTPAQSLLDDAGSDAWATSTTAALMQQGRPVVHTPSRPGDWTLVLSAALQGASVVPKYEVLDSTGASKGATQGAPVPVAAWSHNDAALLKASAEQAAPQIDALLTRIEAARLHDDPNSLQNRPARVYLTGISGAPGDGNRSLAVQIRTKLADQGVVVQDTADGADYRLRCEITASPAPANQLKVELQWVIDDARGERGRVVQLNEVPKTAIDRYWGDVAVAVAEQAAGGVKDVLFNAAGPRLPAATPPKK